MFTRWLTASLLAIGLGVAALEVSAWLAEPHVANRGQVSPRSTDAARLEVPSGVEVDRNEGSALPRFTR
jgi:hypothetical protein